MKSCGIVFIERDLAKFGRKSFTERGATGESCDSSIAGFSKTLRRDALLDINHAGFGVVAREPTLRQGRQPELRLWRSPSEVERGADKFVTKHGGAVLRRRDADPQRNPIAGQLAGTELGDVEQFQTA